MKFNIFVDGIEGSGKSYLVGKMANALQGLDVKTIRFPSDDFKIKYLSQDVEPPDLNGLFYMDMVEQLKARGSVDICLYDRSFLSPIVYNTDMKKEYIDGLFKQIEKDGFYNIFIFIDIPVKDALVNIGKRKKPFNSQNAKNIDRLEMVREDYYMNLDYAYPHCNEVICLDGMDATSAFDIVPVLKRVEYATL